MKILLLTFFTVFVLEVIAIGDLMEKLIGFKAIVEITFWDHSQHQGENPGLIECKVYGILKSETKDAYEVCSWAAAPYTLSTSNDECFTIIKKAVTNLRVLRKISL